MKINILGTEYTIEERPEKSDPKLENRDGYTDSTIKLCVVDAFEESCVDDQADIKGVYVKRVMRHEIIHAFLFESGLDGCSWADNEALVDWIAIQIPKLAKVMREAGCL